MLVGGLFWGMGPAPERSLLGSLPPLDVRVRSVRQVQPARVRAQQVPLERQVPPAQPQLAQHPRGPPALQAWVVRELPAWGSRAPRVPLE